MQRQTFNLLPSNVSGNLHMGYLQPANKSAAKGVYYARPNVTSGHSSPGAILAGSPSSYYGAGMANSGSRAYPNPYGTWGFVPHPVNHNGHWYTDFNNARWAYVGTIPTPPAMPQAMPQARTVSALRGMNHSTRPNTSVAQVPIDPRISTSTAAASVPPAAVVSVEPRTTDTTSTKRKHNSMTPEGSDAATEIINFEEFDMIKPTGDAQSRSKRVMTVKHSDAMEGISVNISQTQKNMDNTQDTMTSMSQTFSEDNTASSQDTTASMLASQ